jgi:hypothetical protein
MNRFLLFIYLLFLLLVAVYMYKKPAYNWDMIPYMAITLQHDQHDPAFVHDSVYALIRQQLPADTYGQLIDGGLPYRKKMAEDPAAFTRQMPFYLVKPLYTGLVYLAYKSGLSLLRATVFPSVLCFFLIGTLLVRWIRKYIQGPLAVLFSTLVMLSAPMWDLARSSSPDGLSALLLLLAFYALMEKGSLLLIGMALLGAIFARIDNVIPATFVATLLVYSGNISRKYYAALLACIIVSYGCVTFTTHAYGWNVLYYPTFARSLNLTYTYDAGFHLRDYIDLVKSHVMTGLFSSSLLLFLALGSLAFIREMRPTLRNLDADQRLLIAIFGTIALRFVLQPVIADRLYVAYYLCILIVLIRKFWARPVMV